MKNTKKKKIIIIVAVLIVLGILLYLASNYIIWDKNKTTKLVINNNDNISRDMEGEVVIDNSVIYLCENDVKRFFDKYITEIDGKIVTTYDKKIAEIGFDSNEMELNDSTVRIKATAKKGDDGNTYLPISEMKDVYGIEVTYIPETNVVTIDSTDRAQTAKMVNKNAAVKSSTGLISKTVARVKKGDTVIKINEKDGWTKIRTNGKVGYVKTNKLGDDIIVREDLGEQNQIDGKVNMVWDYFYTNKTAPNRNGTQIKGVNVVSPSFFYIDNQGKLQENIGDAGKKYIDWAHENGYKVWPMVSNAGDGMIDVTSSIMNDYSKRKEIIKGLVDASIKYNLDGINIDFENMKQEDKDLYSRFIIELSPRIKEIGDVLSVDVTAPDGGETWSMCFDRHVIGDVANYIVFMAYDEYGVSSNKAGTTAGYDWVKLSLQKFLQTEEIESNKIILGVPFYTRVWTEKGDGTATSSVVNMKDINRVVPNGVEKKWDDSLKQNYAEYTDGGATKKMWIEDEESLKAKLTLISENNLGGVAEWQKDMENDDIWEIIDEAIK